MDKVYVVVLHKGAESRVRVFAAVPDADRAIIADIADGGHEWFFSAWCDIEGTADAHQYVHDNMVTIRVRCRGCGAVQPVAKMTGMADGAYYCGEDCFLKAEK